MKKKEIICAFYYRNDTERNEYNDFMRNLANHKKKLKPLYYENIDGKILIVFYKKKLKSIKSLKERKVQTNENIKQTIMKERKVQTTRNVNLKTQKTIM